LTSAVPVASKDPSDPQKMGGAITYYRRYSLLALLGLAPEDDDGNAASKPAPPAKAPETRPQPPSAPEPPALAPQASQPRKVADWDSDQLREYANNEAAPMAKRKAAFGHLLARFTREFDVLGECARMKALHPEDVAELRDKALGALRDRQPATA
jgi:hypothetical protein